MSWKRLLLLFFVLVLVDGALRKWLFPGQANLIYFAKDFTLMGAFGLFLLQHRAGLPEPLRGSLVAVATAAYAFWAALQFCNFRAPNFAVSALGVKSHLLYLVLAVMMPVLLHTRTRVVDWTYRYVLFAAVPISLLGIYQFFLPYTHWLNQYVSEAPLDIATVGFAGNVRVTGTFSYISGMSTFVIFNLGLALGLLLAGLRFGGRSRWVGAGLLAVSLVVAPMTGSRTALYLPALALPFVLYGYIRHGALNLRLLVPVLLGILAIFFVRQTKLEEGWLRFMERVENTTDTEARVQDALWGPVEKLEAAGFFGYGVGTTHQAAPQLVPGEQPYAWLPENLDFEEENGRIGLELGLVGFILYFTMKLGLCGLAVRVLQNARSEAELTFGVAAVVFLCVQLIGGMVFNATAGAIYWGLAGTVMALRSAQRQREGWAVSRSRLTAAVV